jgi:hypothetical protein
VGCAVTTVSVHGAASTLSPVTANSVPELGTTASVLGCLTGGPGGRRCRGLTQNWLTSASNRRRAGGGRGSSGGDGVLAGAAILASISLGTVTIRRSAVSVSRAASTESTLGVAGGAVELFAASAIVTGARGRLSGRWLGGVVAAGKAASSAVSRSRSTPSVRAAARAGVSSALGVAQQVAVVRATFAVGGVFAGLPLLREANGRAGPGSDLGVLRLGVGGTGVALCAVLAGQALEGVDRGEVAGRVDPEKVDVGCGKPGEGAEAEDRGLHGGCI